MPLSAGGWYRRVKPRDSSFSTRSRYACSVCWPTLRTLTSAILFSFRIVKIWASNWLFGMSSDSRTSSRRLPQDHLLHVLQRLDQADRLGDRLLVAVQVQFIMVLADPALQVGQRALEDQLALRQHGGVVADSSTSERLWLQRISVFSLASVLMSSNMLRAGFDVQAVGRFVPDLAGSGSFNRLAATARRAVMPIENWEMGLPIRQQVHGADERRQPGLCGRWPAGRRGGPCSPGR